MLYAVLFLPALVAVVYVVTRARRPVLVLEEAVREDPFSTLETLLEKLEAATLEERDVAELERAMLRMRGEPGLRRSAHTPLLLGADRAERTAEAVRAALLHLDETQHPAAADDQVELVAAGADVCADDAPAAQPVPPGSAPFTPVQAPRTRAR